MKQLILLAFVLLLTAAFVLPQANAQTTHNVTFIVNTATVPDTINSKSPVQITGGGSKGGDTVLTSWGTGVQLDTIGGDYWIKTLTFADSASIDVSLHRVWGLNRLFHFFSIEISLTAAASVRSSVTCPTEMKLAPSFDCSTAVPGAEPLTPMSACERLGVWRISTCAPMERKAATVLSPKLAATCSCDAMATI